MTQRAVSDVDARHPERGATVGSPESKDLEPEIRFAGFADPWEQRKLGELASEFQSGEFISAEEITENGEYPVYGGNGLRGYTNHYNHDGFYALIGRQGALCGNVNSADGKAYFTEHAVAVKANESNDTSFLVHLLGHMDLGQYSGQSAQPGLAVGVLKEVESLVPVKLEQRAIGQFFSQLDSLITLHQRKYDRLRIVKKSMLESMFPRDGATEPEIRLAGFADPWEQRKLGEIVAELATGKSVNSTDEPAADDDVAVLKTSCVSSGRFDPSERKKVVEGELGLVACPVVKGCIIVSRMNTPDRVGACGIAADNYPNIFLPDRLWRLSLTDDADPYLVYTSLASDASQAKIKGMASGTSGSMHNVPQGAFLEMELDLPASFPEQRAIGQFFSRLDSLITLHQRKLDLLRNVKRALLDKMFV